MRHFDVACCQATTHDLEVAGYDALNGIHALSRWQLVILELRWADSRTDPKATMVLMQWSRR
jgi:hypothetical protein